MQQSNGGNKTKCDHRVASQTMHLLAVSGFESMQTEHVQVLDAVEGAFAPAAAQSKLFTTGVADGLLREESQIAHLSFASAALLHVQ